MSKSHRVQSIVMYATAPFVKSLATSLVIGTLAALIGVAVGAALYFGHAAWYLSAASGPVVDTLVVTCLLTIGLERARKRSIHRNMEISYLNHHVHNGLAQMVMASDLTEAEKRERYIREAVNRISEALLRAADGANPNLLSLKVDLQGAELTRQREERERQWKTGEPKAELPS